VTVKTLVPRGTITGKVSGAPTGDLMAVAYDAADEVADQTSVRGDGSYTLQVRPGTFKVHLQYVGRDGHTSRWAAAGGGSTVPSRATAVKVAQDRTSTAPAVTLGRGATVTGAITDPSGKAVRDVDVTALSAVTAEREVVDVSRTSTGYTLEGLPDGKYWLRFVYSGDGFKTRSVSLDVTKGSGRTIKLDTRLENAPFRTRYGASISGSKRVGQTLTAKATPWLAGSYPTTRATMSFQWLRNGAAISGATKATYKLGGADRGKKISVRATARRYGYATGSATSTAYAIS
jgi:carboxypeptidase family protein